MPRITSIPRANIAAANYAVTDAPVNSSSPVSVEDFDYEDRFIPVALQIIPGSRGADGDSEVLKDT